jgi:hypothetical protein
VVIEINPDSSEDEGEEESDEDAQSQASSDGGMPRLCQKNADTGVW